jgi:hypothetical protein
MGSLKISPTSYADKPMDLSNYLMIRTKEKMILEAKMNRKELIFKGRSNIKDLDLAKQIDAIRKDIDENFVKLDRMLSIAKDREQEIDFPVGFVTNLLYIVSINGLSHKLISPKSLNSYLDIIIQKQDFMHLEGIGHCARALEEMGIFEHEVWKALDS